MINKQYLVENEQAATENRERRPHKLYRRGTHPEPLGLTNLPIEKLYSMLFIPKNIVKDTLELSPYARKHNRG